MLAREPRKCAVCIPTYNQSSYVAEAVKSAISQSTAVNVFVSNDASSDDTAKVLTDLQQSYDFTVQNQPVNLGIGPHVRWLLRQAENPLIVRLDSDDLLHPCFVTELTILLERHPTAGYAHCAVSEIDGNGMQLRVRRLARTEGFEAADTALRKAVKGYRVAANIVMFRREALAAVEFGSEKLNFAEDYDLSVRIADAGWGNVYSAKVLASYRVWESSSRPAVRRKLQELEGYEMIFAGSLATAFARRRWNDRAIRTRRSLLALRHAEFLDRANLEPVERVQIAEALTRLAGTRAFQFLFSDHIFSRHLRAIHRRCGQVAAGFKQTVKSIFFAGAKSLNLKMKASNI
jgi:cellulose synthase/poly-beta-1,6-N-acetylglucosamine synthase-like glycosyltransferase